LQTRIAELVKNLETERKCEYKTFLDAEFQRFKDQQQKEYEANVKALGEKVAEAKRVADAEHKEAMRAIQDEQRQSQFMEREHQRSLEAQLCQHKCFSEALINMMQREETQRMLIEERARADRIRLEEKLERAKRPRSCDVC
jgi:uncharacterized protein YhaN